MSDHDPVSRLNAALEGRYRIERQIGAGGMATVYLADDLRHERQVALKVLKPELAAVVGAERFLAEIKTTAKLQHPHILPLHDSGEADGFLFYVMPYVEGESLRERLDREHQLAVDEAVRIAADVAEALEYAHSHGVIHRDIKPANILMQSGKPVVSDFGIALAVGIAGGGRLTETGLSLGTPHYMSPEQATGELSVGGATDVYALGCVLYEMLVGEPPYTGSTAQAILGKIIQAEPMSATKSRRSVPVNVDATIRKALEKVSADRFASARDFARALGDPAFRHGDAATGIAASSPGGWNRLTTAFAATTALFAAALAWTLYTPPPTLPVERFESPFRPGQEPICVEPACFALSPDGSMVVYRGPGPDGEGGQLWVRRWDDPEATPVRGTAGTADFPTVSPDGRELAYALDGEIFARAFEGGPARELGQGREPHWGSDGYVYFESLGEVVGRAQRVPSSGGGAVEVVSTPELVNGERHVVVDVLPGGEGALMLALGLSRETAIYALDLRTGESAFLMAGGSASYVETGHLMAVVEGALMVAPFDARSMELRGPPVPIEDGVTHADVSRTGKLVYASGGSLGGGINAELVWMTRSGEAIPVDSGWTFNLGIGNPGWSLSPDGTRIALRQWSDGDHDIWIKELPDGPLRRLTLEPGEQWSPFWSPDGSMLGYLSGVGTTEAALYAAPADGTGAPALLLEGAYPQAAWSPDGSWLVLRTPSLSAAGLPSPGARDIAAFRPGVDEEVTPLLTSSEYAEQDPAVSPDGRWLAYTSNETGRTEVFVVPFPEVGSGKWQVSINGGIAPVWDPGGGELFYIDGENRVIASTLEVDGGFRVVSREALFALPGEQEYLFASGDNTVDIAPDGQRFLFGREVSVDSPEVEGGGPSIVLVQNFFTELRQRFRD